jgi:long-chain acyl-CoA synthetase
MHLTQGIHRAVQFKPDAIATIFGDRRRTWRDLGDRVARLASVLVSLGLKPGDRIAAIALNSDRYLELYYAAWWAGGVIVPCNTRWALPEHIHALNDCGAEILLVDKTFAALTAPIAQQCPIRSILYFDEGPAPQGAIDLEAMVAAAPPIDDRCVRDDELAALFYTGGTTGRSKGVMLSHRSMVAAAMSICASVARDDQQIFLHSPPMFHVGDAGMMVCVTMVAGAHVIIPTFTPERLVQSIEAEQVNCIHLVPTMFGMLREYLDTHPAELGSVRQVTYGAAPITETLLVQAMEMFPNAEFAGGFGLTEASVGTILPMRFHAKFANGKSYLRSAGRAMVGVDVKVIDEQLDELPRGDLGEILLRSPGAMLGYWRQSELTQKTLVDGWVRTGDVGYMDEEGFVYLVDRLKDMIVSGGENVYSAEVENAISTHAGVLECAIIGVPDEKWGERVHAVVRLRPEAELSEEDLIAHCQRQIARYKCPRSVAFSTDPLPLSAAGKVLKTELRKRYWTRSGALATVG